VPWQKAEREDAARVGGRNKATAAAAVSPSAARLIFLGNTRTGGKGDKIWSRSLAISDVNLSLCVLLRPLLKFRLLPH
jgi:hypothetical protein